MAIEDKLLYTRYDLDDSPHIRVDSEACRNCQEKPCLYICPVQNYKLEDGELKFTWQPCQECGACRIVCQECCDIDWSYPRGEYGVCFRYG